MAKADRDLRDVTELKVQHICKLMRDWQWRTGETNASLAEQWGVTPEYVTDLATIASRRVLAEVADPDVVKRDIATALLKIISDALASTDPRDRKNAIEAAKTYAMLTGAMAARKIEKTVRLGDAPPDDDARMFTEMRAAVREAEARGLIPPEEPAGQVH